MRLCLAHDITCTKSGGMDVILGDSSGIWRLACYAMWNIMVWEDCTLLIELEEFQRGRQLTL